MHAPLRILHIVPGLQIGGAERMLEDVVKGVGAPRATHTVLDLQNGGPMQEPLERAGAQVLSAQMAPSLSSLHKLRRLGRLVRKSAPNIVHGWMSAANLMALLAQRLGPSAPALVMSLHSAAPYWPQMSLRHRTEAVLNTLLAAQADALIYVAHASAQAYKKAGFAPGRAHVIAGGTDTTHFSPNPNAGAALRHRLGIAANSRVVGMLARYHPAKAHDVFVRAAQALLQAAPDDGPQWHFLLAGSGLASPPQALARLMPAGLKQRIHFLDAQSDVAPILQGLDICTLSSTQEALPKILLEALAAGALCVATDVGDNARLLDSVGWVVPPGCAEALATAWRQGLACSVEEAQHRRRLGRWRIESHFSQGQFASKMAALYQSLGVF